MRETIAEVMTAGAFLLSPNPTEQPAMAEPIPHIEVVADNQDLASTQAAEVSSDSASQYNVAISEMLDPNTAIFWVEVGGASLGLGGVSGYITRRQLRKSLRRNYGAIKEEGRNAQAEISNALEAAKRQAAGLREDDVPKLRELMQNHNVTATDLFVALNSTDPEFDAEQNRLFPLKRRLQSAPQTELVMKTTKKAVKQAAVLQGEVARIQTDLAEIDTNISHAGATVSDLHADLEELTNKGWDVSTYKQQANTFADAVAVAQAKWDERYIDEPTRIAKTTTAEALQLKKDAAALEPRRAAADETYNAQHDRFTAAETTANTIRRRFVKLQDTYNPACLVDFEDLQDELDQTVAALTSAHHVGGSLTGKQGMSVEAVNRSEELIASFDKSLGEIQAVESSLQQREDHLAILVEKLPRKVNKLSAQFERAMELVGDPDVEGEASDDIRSFTDDVANLSTSISTAGGQKPDYLTIEKRHATLAKDLDKAHKTAAQQKQEMDNLRTNIPQLTEGHNQLVAGLKTFANQHNRKLEDDTWAGINKLSSYEQPLAANRQNLREQQAELKKRIQKARKLMKQAEEDAEEDSLLLSSAKLVGGAALIAIGVDIFND